MSKYCLIKSLATKFKEKLSNGEIDPEKLASMSSAERHSVLEKIVGKDASNVNALFERKLLQKYKWKAYIDWAKEVTGIKPEIRRDLISRISKMANDTKINILNPAEEKMFMQDLVNSKLGMNVTFEESKKISELSKKLLEAKRDWQKTGNGKLYGASQVAMERFVGDIKVKDISQIEWKNPIKLAEYIAGNAKAVKASMDNSFALRQGLKTLWTHPIIWSKDFVKSFGDIAKGLGGNKNDVMDGIKAEIYGRDNSINGTYKKMKLDLGGVEEAYPETLGEKIPLFRRLYIASEVAYNGMGMRLRADLADSMIDLTKKQGVDLEGSVGNKGLTEQESIGRMINSLTGRGNLGKLDVIGKDINVLFFSPKFLKSQVDVLTQPFTGAGGSNFVRKEASKNLLKIAAGTASVLFIADRMWPGSVDWDPRSSNFGKIKIGNTRFDVTGGMGSLITLTTRIVPTKHDGEWGLWSKSSGNNQYTKLNSGFGVKTGTDIINDFFMGKLSPSAGLVRDMLRQKDMQGNPINLTLKSAGQQAMNLFAPLPITNAIETFKDPNAAPLWVAMVADGLGISTNTYSATTNWNSNTGVELNQFKEIIGQKEFDNANKEYNQQVSDKLVKMLADERYKKLSNDDKQKAITKLRANIKEDLFKRYKFTYKPKKTNKSELKTINSVSK